MKKCECCAAEKKCGCPLKKLLKAFGVLALLAGAAYLVWYFFFADDCEDLDDDFFAGEEAKAE